uniref:Uncharacterized protein n=1 Tax=Peronospora matthiolae TaxID=2874970 RepID=A0AAV1T3Y3_9STRA
MERHFRSRSVSVVGRAFHTVDERFKRWTSVSNGGRAFHTVDERFLFAPLFIPGLGIDDAFRLFEILVTWKDTAL